MTIEYIYRPKSLAVSIERVFESVIKGVESQKEIVVERSWIKQFSLWPFGIVYNILRYCFRSYLHRNKIYHITGDVQYVACLMNPRNTIMTIHDLVPLHNDRVPWYSKKLCYWLWYYSPLRRLRFVTCISETTKQDLIHYFPWVEDKVSVVRNPVDDRFVYTPKDINIEKPRILHIGTKENKNLLRVITALDGQRCHLRIVGKLNKEQQEALNKKAVEYSNIWGINDEEMLQEYQNADLISFPSTFEGFGMPIIEGQAVGRPVVTSNIEPMLSVAGDAAIVVDPYNIASIRKGLMEHTQEELSAIVARGLANVEEYSGKAVACQYIELYKYLL